jgi:recombination protein RecA
VDVIVVDSVAALTPQAEIDGDMGDSHMGLQARLMSQALRKLTGLLSKSNTTIIFINQIRMKIGVMFGNPETTTGGNALKFYASVRIEVRKIESLSKGADDIIGNRIRIKVVKNKVSPPFKKVELDLMFGEGISYISSVLDAALKYEMLEKSGSWYSYNGEKIGQGRDKTLDFLKDNPDIVADLDVKLRALMFPKKVKEPKNGKEATKEKDSSV